MFSKQVYWVIESVESVESIESTGSVESVGLIELVKSVESAILGLVIHLYHPPPLYFTSLEGVIV